MTDRKLKKIVTSFRAGILGKGRPPTLMCFAVCAPLQGYLSAFGIETALVELVLPEVNHYVLRLGGGRIIDPTADQFGLEPVYIGRMPLVYETRQARMVEPHSPSLLAAGGDPR